MHFLRVGRCQEFKEHECDLKNYLLHRCFNCALSSPLGTKRFDVNGKLAAWYVGPYQIEKKVRSVAYQLQLPRELADVHPLFHVSLLRKCLRVPDLVAPTDVLDWQETLE